MRGLLIWIFASLVLAAPAQAQAQAPTLAQAQPMAERAVLPLDSGWRFKLGDAGPVAVMPAYDDAAWSKVNLPHTWNNIGGYPERPKGYNDQRGQGWYRLAVTPPPSFDGKRVFVEFDAASSVADVWMNGVHIGRHKGGYSRFRLDVTRALKPSGDNILVVRADNSISTPGGLTENVAPFSGDFFPYGGLYRKARLIAVDPVHVDLLDYGGPGVYAHAESVTSEAAQIAVLTRLANDGAKAALMTVRHRILDASGRTMAMQENRAGLAPGARAEHQAVLTLPRPRLWNGRADPYLYRVVTEILGEGGRVLDRVDEPLGVRTFRIDPAEGFFLNGKPLKLHGVSRHQDRPDKGYAISDDDAREDMKLIAEIGATTVRFAHYNHAQIWSQLADEAGMVAWAEIPLVGQFSPADVGAISPAFEDNARQQLTELIRQNYNHPSIIVWSLGNETTQRRTEGLQSRNSVRPLLNELNALAKREDPSRMTTIALCCELAAFERDGVRDYAAGTADTAGWNLYYGWYRGRTGDLGPFLTKAHESEPNLPLSLAEYGVGGSVIQHADDPLGGPVNVYGRPHPEIFQSRWHEESWKQVKGMKFLWGTWIWNMFDFSSHIRAEGDSLDTNDKGLVSFDRKTRKDAFWFYKAQWNPAPMIHLAGGHYADRIYPVIDIKAYTNAPAATLTLNGRKIGETACPDGVCEWKKVRLARGENRAVATAKAGGKRLRSEVRWRLSGDPRMLNIRAGTLTPYTAPDGTRFGTDVYFSGGDGKNLNKQLRPQDAPDPKAKTVSAPADLPLYESFREGRFSYALPLPDGAYQVTMRAYEPLPEAKPGARVFSIVASGGTGISNLDLAAVAGPLKAVERTFAATASGGVLTLDFVPSAGAAIVSAISVKPR